MIFAQETSGNLKGIVRDYNKNVIANATVSLIQMNNGSKYYSNTSQKGEFYFRNLQPDNSYSIIITNIGFKEFRQENINILLGETKFITVELIENNQVLDEVVVKSNQSIQKKFEKRIDLELLNKLPTANRSIQDATRLLPEANLNSFGGANYRFNNLSIDGSATNDVLGFQEPASGASGSVASGTPGGLAGTQPIGFGAIAAISVKSSPFDVALGNFTGASINAITRYGKNKTELEVYSFLKNKILQGNYSDGIKQANNQFSDAQYGVTLGGAIKKNKLFYFFNAEFDSKNTPVVNTPGTENSNISLDAINSIENKLITSYNYNPGSKSNVDLQTHNIKLFFRLDYSISDKHKLTIRNNFVTGFNDNLERTTNVFNFGNQGYRHHSTTNSLVGELKSKINSKINNKLNVSFTSVNDKRTFDGDLFPHLEINESASNIIFAGTYREASVYGLTLNTCQFKDDITYKYKNHLFNLGTSFEYNNIQYRFLTAFNGRWQYRSVADFLNDKPNRVRGVYNIENNDFDFNKNTPSANYNVLLSSVYFQDEIKISDKLSFQAGIRVDAQATTDFPLSQEVKNTPEFSKYTNKINSKPQINPRFSFEYKLDENKKYVLKGGTGFFTGRMPFVWYAYAHYISGTKYYNIDYRPTTNLAIVNDVSQIESLQSRPLTEINLVDNNFNLPRDWKSNLNFEVHLKNNYILTFEGTYTKVNDGLLFQSINRKESALSNFSGADNRPYYTLSGDAVKINPNFTNVFLLTNTNKGYRYNVTFSISKTEKRYTGFLGYSYGTSKDISSTVRNSHAANFEWNQAIVANNPDLSYSNFDLRHKISSYHFITIPVKKASLNVGLILNSKSGSPFSYVSEGDVNRDGSAKNDLVYIPNNQSEIVLANIVDSNNNIVTSAQDQWIQLDNFISNDSYLSKRRGQYAERNGARTPWNHQIDTKLLYKTIIFKTKLEISLDIFNFTNLINKNWGRQTFVPNVNNSGFALLDFIKIENEKPVYQFNNNNKTPYLVDNLASRWQMQLGINLKF
jgi:hypothetical protein